MREMVLDTLREVTYSEHTKHHGSCRPKGRLHDHLCRPRPDRQGADRAKERAPKGSRKSEGVPSAEQHARNFNHLDAARISLAKALNDADSSVTSEQAELTRLKEELHELEGGERPGRRGRI